MKDNEISSEKGPRDRPIVEQEGLNIKLAQGMVQTSPIVNLSQDWFTAMLWVAFRLGLSSILNAKERGEVSDILDKKMVYYFEQHQRLPTGYEIMWMFEQTYDDVYNFYHGYYNVRR